MARRNRKKAQRRLRAAHPIDRPADQGPANAAPGSANPSAGEGRVANASGACPLCERDDVELTEHHLVPVHKGGRRGPTAMLCINCHKQIHAVFTNNELRDLYRTVEALKAAPELQPFYRFIRRRPFRRLRTRQTREKRERVGGNGRRRR